MTKPVTRVRNPSIIRRLHHQRRLASDLKQNCLSWTFSGSAQTRSLVLDESFWPVLESNQEGHEKIWQREALVSTSHQFRSNQRFYAHPSKGEPPCSASLECHLPCCGTNGGVVQIRVGVTRTRQSLPRSWMMHWWRQTQNSFVAHAEYNYYAVRSRSVKLNHSLSWPTRLPSTPRSFVRSAVSNLDIQAIGQGGSFIFCSRTGSLMDNDST